MKFENITINELPKIAEGVISNIPVQSIVILEGELAAGKTTFVKAMVNTMCEDCIVNSPTFNIMQTYKINDDEIVHVDAYRINQNDYETIDMIIEHINYGKYSFIEWGNNIIDELKEFDKLFVIKISINSDESRNITCEEVI